MKKVKLGIYLEEDEYRQRFTCYFMNHYKDQIEIYIYTDMEQLLQAAGGTIDVALAEETDCWNREDIPLVQLVDETPLQTEEGVFYVEKYQEINKIVDEILKHVGSEVKNLHNEGCGAVNIVIVHNHPSGNAQPSLEDVKVTKKVKDASKLIGLNFCDHIIIGQDGYFSFSKANLQ